MQYVLIIHAVADYAKWKTVFDGAAAIRRAAGERRYQVLRYEHDPERIVHFSAWTSIVDARRFFESPELVKIRQDAGVKVPEFIYLDLLDEGQYGDGEGGRIYQVSRPQNEMVSQAVGQPRPLAAHWADFEGVTYLNFAGHAARPWAVTEAVRESLQLCSRPDRLGDVEFFQVSQELRDGLAALINACPDDVALTTGASAGLAHCAQALSWTPGDEVLIAGGDFPSHHSTWSPWARRQGLTLRTVQPAGVFPTAGDFAAALTPKVRVLSVSHVRFDDGSLLDVPALAEACLRNHTLLVLDVSQSCGAIPIDVATLGADLLVCAGYKYLLGPWGAGFLWAGPRAQAAFQETPANWLAQGVRAFSDLVFVEPELLRCAARWDSAEAGTLFNLNLSAFRASVGFVQRAGVAHVRGHLLGLLGHLREAAGDSVQWVSPADPKSTGPFLCLQGNTEAQGKAIHEALAAERIVAALRNGRVRIAPYLMHKLEDMERVAGVLREVSGHG